MKEVIKIGLKYDIEDSYDMAYKYYSILSIMNELSLVKRDVQLLAYSVSEKKAVSEVKEEFIEKFGTSMATVGNIISKLYKKGILVKDKKVVSIVEVLNMKFENNFVLGMQLIHKDNGDKG